jgi:hypothetical protein
VFIGEILANMTQVSDVAPGPLVYYYYYYFKKKLSVLRKILAVNDQIFCWIHNICDAKICQVASAWLLKWSFMNWWF